jgi:hypothetical protein
MGGEVSNELPRGRPLVVIANPRRGCSNPVKLREQFSKLYFRGLLLCNIKLDRNALPEGELAMTPVARFAAILQYLIQSWCTCATAGKNARGDTK